MEINTKQWGLVTFTDNDVFDFPDGLPGFPERRKFIFVSLDEESPLFFMQSVEDENLSFVVVNPFHFFPDYSFDLPQIVLDKLAIENRADVEVWNIVVIRDPFEKSTVNLQAPIIVNSKTRKAKQAVLNHPDYSIRHYLFPQEKTKINTITSQR